MIEGRARRRKGWVTTEAVYCGIDEAERERAAALVMLGFGSPHRSDYARRTAAQEFRVLEVDGELASVARLARLGQWWHGRLAPSAQVLQFVTAPEHRGHGYAAGATAAASRAALDAGVDEVLLYTDLANPTSNRLYARLGYRPVEDSVAFVFGD
jgi:predicted GNAT family acetyltransferase